MLFLISGKRSLAAGTAVLSVFSLITRFIGMAYRLYLTARIGAEGIGLYQLIMSVYTLFATFA
ncbi:MAG TPA: oligosaccharide flippase family protein, partial [Bacillota bacterium]|nr:oligosaccharide flippase family protein [Bacillota bacterium]